MAKTVKARQRPAARRVIVVQWADMTCFREMLRGISAFANARLTWQLHFFVPSDNYLPFIEQQKPDGLVLGLVDREDGLRATAHARGCVGAVGWSRADGDVFTSLESDDVRAGELAAQHFIQKGYTEFAYVGNSAAWSFARAAGFERELEKAGHSCAQLHQKWEPPIAGRGWHSTDLTGELIDWIKALKRPLALLACNDLRARIIAQLCRENGLHIPDEIAILGVDNDELDCELASPPLSSVAVPWRRIGYDAAALLDRVLDGEAIEPALTLIPPIGVVERQSTDSVAIADPEVAASVRFIRQNAQGQIGVEDILREVPVGRRSLEQRFQAMLQRTPLEEIRRVRIERAKQLLATTDLPVRDIGKLSGFGQSTWFSEAFLALVGESPARYRRRHQRAV